jgi:hypothetical protein
MNLKTDILKIYTAIFNTEGYNRAIAFETQKPKNDTYVYMAIDNKSQVLKTTGGVVYNIAVSFSFYTNSEIKLNDEIDKLTNILDDYHSYRDTTKTYFYNALVESVERSESEEWKFRVNVTLNYEEVA